MEFACSFRTTVPELLQCHQRGCHNRVGRCIVAVPPLRSVRTEYMRRREISLLAALVGLAALLLAVDLALSGSPQHQDRPGPVSSVSVVPDDVAVLPRLRVVHPQQPTLIENAENPVHDAWSPQRNWPPTTSSPPPAPRPSRPAYGSRGLISGADVADVVDHRVQHGFQCDGVTAGLRHQQAALQRGQQCQRQ